MEFLREAKGGRDGAGLLGVLWYERWCLSTYVHTYWPFFFFFGYSREAYG